MTDISLEFTNVFEYRVTPNGLLRPIIVVTFVHNGLEIDHPMLVDSGSPWTVIPPLITDYLEIDIISLPFFSDGRGIGGAYNYNVLDRLKMRIGPLECVGEVRISDSMDDFSYGLLGQIPFFDIFRVGFQQKYSQLYVAYDD